MTDPDIERLAREAGLERDGESWFTPSGDPLDTFDVSTASLARFAALISAHERERCATVCDDAKAAIWNYHDKQVKDTAETVCINLAAAIRAL